MTIIILVVEKLWQMDNSQKEDIYCMFLSFPSMWFVDFVSGPVYSEVWTTQWLIPSKLSFIAGREMGSWDETRNQSCYFSPGANTTST